MIAMLNSHLVLHKETLKQHFEKKSMKHLIKIIYLGTKNAPIGRNGLTKKQYLYADSQLHIKLKLLCIFWFLPL